MKKIFCILTVVLLCLPLKAQDWKIRGFEPQIRLTFDEGLDYQKNFSFGLDLVAAYRFNEFIRLGGGVGLDYINMRFEESKFVGYKFYKEYNEAAMTIPVFANIKADFSRTKVAPYLSLDCGYNFFIPFSDYAKDNKLGFFVRPALGIDIKLSSCTLFIDVAYKYQNRSFENAVANYHGYHQICQSIGISF